MKSTLFCFLLTISTISIAGDTEGKIVGLNTGTAYPNLAFIDIESNNINKASCSTNGDWEYVFKIDDDIGKATLSFALAAYSSGATVFLDGINTCPDFSSVESFRRIVIKN